MRRSWPLRAILVLSVLAGAVALTVMSGSAGQPEPDAVPRAPAGKPADGPPNHVAKQVKTAPAGKVLAHGPGITVDEITVEPGKSVARLTIAGEFPLRSLDPTVLLDGKPVGRGIPAANMRAISVAVDAKALRTGASMAYQYGPGPVQAVGTLTMGAK